MSRKAKAPHKTIERYTHGEKRVNNPPAGLVNHHTDSGEDQAEYAAPPPRDSHYPPLCLGGQA